MHRKIAVCDDERLMLRQLSQYLTRIQDEMGEQFDLTYFASSEELLVHLPKHVQVILLDISMGGMTGIECARVLRANGCEAAIIFITNLTEYALEGYEVQAFAFLPKPVLYAELKDRLVKCFARIDQQHRAVLSIKTDEGIEILPIEEILYAEVYQHETSFALPDKQITGVVQLSQIEEKLMLHGFFRCHRSYLVNMAQIKRISADAVIMLNGASIPVSRHRRKAFLDAFASYMGG